MKRLPLARSAFDIRLSCTDIEKAIRKCPLDKVIEVRECFDPAYLFA
jgi:hypothetical protein